MTREEIKAFLPSLSDGEVVDLEASANADSEEGVEWLPYYKMALSRLVECAGALRALENNTSAVAVLKIINDASRLYYEHLLFSGIGPRRDPETIRRCEEAAASAMASFVEREI
jgi:hypothetical protein